MSDTLAKKSARLAVEAIAFAILSPLLLLLSVLCGAHSAWKRFELWAYYDGDPMKREKAEWRLK